MADPSTLAVFLTALLPTVAGGSIAHLNLFLVPRETLRQRIDLRRLSLIDGLTLRHVKLLNHARKIDDDALLRGDGHKEPDLVDEYAKEMVRLVKIFRRLDHSLSAVDLAYSFLFTTAAIGLVLSILSLLFIELRLGATWFGSVAFLAQIMTVISIRYHTEKVEAIDDVV